MRKLLLFIPAIALAMQSCVPLKHQTMQQQLEDNAPSGQEASNGGAPLPKMALTPDLVYKVLLADVARKRGHVDVAKKEYDELAKLTRDPRLVERAARVAFIARDNELALKNAKLWSEIDPENLEARKLLSVLLIKTHHTAEAVEHLEKLISDYWSNNLQGFLLIARLLGNEKDSEVAFSVMQKLVARHPDVPEAQFALAELAMRAENTESADKAILKALALKPDWQEAVIFRTRVLQAKNKLPEAIDYLATQVKANKANLNLRLTYARLLLEAKRYRDARAQFKILADQAPENDDILYALGGLSLEVKQYDEAEIYLKRLIEMEKKTLVASYFLGQVKEEQKKDDEAVRWYSRVDRGEHYLGSQIRIAMIYARGDKVQQAREHLDTIEVHNKDERVRLFIARGEIYRESKQYQKEYDAYDKALKEYPEETNLLYARALAAERVGKLAVVEGDLRKILITEPDNAAALNALGYTLADRTDRYDEAYNLIKKALQLRPDDGAIMDSMGWVEYRRGHYKEAEKYLRKAIAQSEDPEIAAHLGEVLWALGNQQGAKEIWGKARTSAPENEVLLNVLQKYGQL